MRAHRGVAGLVFAFQCMSRGHEFPRDTGLIFLNRIGKEIRSKCVLKLGYVVSGWRSVIAGLLKVGGGESLICTCAYKTQHTPRACICYCFVLKDSGPTESNTTGQSTYLSARL